MDIPKILAARRAAAFARAVEFHGSPDDPDYPHDGGDSGGSGGGQSDGDVVRIAAGKYKGRVGYVERKTKAGKYRVVLGEDAFTIDPADLKTVVAKSDPKYDEKFEELMDKGEMG